MVLTPFLLQDVAATVESVVEDNSKRRDFVDEPSATNSDTENLEGKGSWVQNLPSPVAPAPMAGFLGSSPVETNEVEEHAGRQEPVPCQDEANVAIDFSWSVSETVYDLVHCTPLILDYGNLTALTDKDVLVWAAFRYDTVDFQTVVDNSSVGTTIILPEPLIITIQPMGSVTVIIREEVFGAPTISGTIDFTFSVGPDCTLILRGSRIGVLLVPPEVPVLEELRFSTDIIEKVNGTEQRIAIRKNPRQVVTYRFNVSGRERRQLQSLFFGKQGIVIVVPIWFESAYLTTDVPSGSSALPVTTVTGIDFREQDFVCVYRPDGRAEIFQTDTIVGTTINTQDQTGIFYPAGTSVMPARRANVRPRLTGRRNVVNFIDFQAEFHVLDNDISIADASAFNTFNGKVFLDGPNAVSRQVQENYRQNVQILDNESGIFEQRSNWQRSKKTSIKGFKTGSCQNLYDVRQLIHFLNGQQTSFYLPTFFDDIIIVQDPQATEATIVIQNIGFSNDVFTGGLHNRIRIHKKDGTIFDRIVVGAVEDNDLEETLTLDTVWLANQSVDDIELVEYLELVRFASDSIKFRHDNNNGEAFVTAPVVRAFDEDGVL